MKRILLSSIIIASLLSAFACGPGGSGGGHGDKIRIGVFMSLTGDTANFGISSVNAIKIAADEVNAAGGINGKQIELDVQDDRSDPSQAAAIVTEFVTQDSVHAILGEVASSLSIAAAPFAQNARIPMLTPSSTNPEVTRKGDYIFRSCFTDPVQGAAIGQFAARTLNARRAAIMVDRKNDYSTGLEKSISQTFIKSNQLGGDGGVEPLSGDILDAVDRIPRGRAGRIGARPRAGVGRRPGKFSLRRPPTPLQLRGPALGSRRREGTSPVPPRIGLRVVGRRPLFWPR